MKRTPLFEEQQKSRATMVSFAGWQMPLHYGSPIEEHLAVRQSLGVFDVSHMGVIQIQGKNATPFLRFLLANDVQKIAANAALYTCLLNDKGGILDDLIVYCRTPEFYYLVVNAATTEKDLNWITSLAESFEVKVSLSELAILALQGPLALMQGEKILGLKIGSLANLKAFHYIEKDNWLIARTGYTGEQGIEILLPQKDLLFLWQKMIEAKVKPIGLAARDTLRIEAGLNLYGHEMDESISPFECHLARTVDWQDGMRFFIGKKALLAKKQGGNFNQLVGLVLLEQGIPRAGMPCTLVTKTNQVLQGMITSGCYSPLLKCGIAMARVPHEDFSFAEIEIRGKKLRAKVVQLPFLRKGKATFTV